MKLLRDANAMKGLQELITRCAGVDEPHLIGKLGKHVLHTRWEMRQTIHISDYEMDQAILDMGSDTNVLPKQTWGRMGRPMLWWPLIQLWMANQQNILPMGRLQGVTMDIDSTKTQTYFQVIEIVNESNPNWCC